MRAGGEGVCRSFHRTQTRPEHAPREGGHRFVHATNVSLSDLYLDVFPLSLWGLKAHKVVVRVVKGEVHWKRLAIEEDPRRLA